MSVKDLMLDELPGSDFHEIACRLADVSNRLDEATNDDYSRQELYDCMSMSAIIINDVIADITAIERVMRAVVDA